MRIRSQRRHNMGASNSSYGDFQSSYVDKTQSVFERSFNKSKSIFHKSNSLLIQNKKQIPQVFKDNSNPFLGTHNQHQTKKFTLNPFNPQKGSNWQHPTQNKPLQPPITLAHHLNRQVLPIKDQLQDYHKDINMHKIKQLKNTFIKNNRNVRDLRQYFRRFCTKGGQGEYIDATGLRRLVKEYGFDVNDSECLLLFRLSQKANDSKEFHDYLKIDQFVQLMTRDNIYYKTLKLNPSLAPNQTFNLSPKRNFSDKIHQILRNKYPNLKQAFKIYRQRKEPIGLKQYEYVMKKLDLTDLVITKEERDKIYRDYSEEGGEFNVEKLVCAIAEQEYANRQLINGDTYKRFQKQIDAIRQIQFQKDIKIRKFSLKNLSSLQYQTQFVKARKVIQQLQKLRRKQKDENKDGDIFKSIMKDGYTTREQLVTNAQKLLKKQGISFHKDEYDAFGSYLNYDVNDNINHQKINQQLFIQTEKQARQRFQRRARHEPPKITIPNNQSNTQNPQQSSLSPSQALQTLKKIQQHKLHPQPRQLFTYFDKDNDGYISPQEFRQKLRLIKGISEEEIDNLGKFIQIDDKGALSLSDFVQKFNHNGVQMGDLPSVGRRSARSCYDWSDVAKTKKDILKHTNQTFYHRPTKFSAWPPNLTTPDLSLLQPPAKSAMHASETQRFSAKRQDYASNQKLIKMNVAKGRVEKIAEWNRIIQDRVRGAEERDDRRQAAKNYSLRVAKEKYQMNCHR